MKTLVTNYTLSGNTVTLGGVNAPLGNLLLISDATTGTVLYSPAGPTLAGYSTIAGGNSVATLSSTPTSGDLLTIYYDNGIAPTNAPSTVTLGGSNITVPVSLNGGRGTNATLPVYDSIVGGTVTLGTGSAAIGSITNTSFQVSSLPANLGTTNLAPAYASITNFPSSQLVSGSDSLGTLHQIRTDSLGNQGVYLTASSVTLPVSISSDTANPFNVTLTGVSGVTLPVSGFPATQNVSLVGNSTSAIGTSLASGPGSNATLPSFAQITNFPSSQTVSGAVSLAAGQTLSSALLIGGNPVTTSNAVPIQPPVSGSLAVSLSSGVGTNSTLPAFNSLVGGSLTLTSSTNPTLGAGSNTIGSVSLIGGNATAVKVDGSAFTQTVGGTVTLGSGTAIIGAVQQGSGTLTMSTGSAGTSSATISFSPTPSKYLRIDNNSAVATLYVSTTTPATSTNSVIIGNTTTAKSFWEPRFVPTNTLYILASAASTPYTLTYA